MKPETFTKWAEAYFGDYPPMVKKEVLRKLEGWLPGELLELRERALEEIETKYKSPPDVSFIHNSAALYNRKSRIRNEKQAIKAIEDAKELAVKREEKRKLQDFWDQENERRLIEGHKKQREDKKKATNEAETFFRSLNKLNGDLRQVEAE